MQFQMQLKFMKNTKNEGVRVLGLATAFEDFDKNNLDNLKNACRNRRSCW